MNNRRKRTRKNWNTKKKIKKKNKKKKIQKTKKLYLNQQQLNKKRHAINRTAIALSNNKILDERKWRKRIMEKKKKKEKKERKERKKWR